MNNAFDTPQRVLILGASSDIAAETARQMAANGTREFVLAARNVENLEPLSEQLRFAGATSIETIAFNALDRPAHEPFISDLWARHHHFDVALIAFGVLDDKSAGGVSDLDTVALTNYVGAISVLQQLARRFENQRRGSIVVLSSVAAERPRANNYLYASTKAGLDSYARGLADELHPDVHVMVVRPGFVNTKMTKHLDAAPFATTAPAVAADIIDGLGKRSSIVWSPEIVRAVMSGLRHLPTPIYRRVAARG